ncbi:unnamed protein product [Durusdinium trenchii]|uniref:C3H1-type domain-containing protein n=1 Tax=Durusdinium trenchii TaxID=1381693 RepID=A0ABP0INB3_9DINO
MAVTMHDKHVQQLQKTQMCKFFMNHRRCGRGSSCTFAHDLSEIRERPNLNRTSMCKAFLTRGSCSNANCAFAHDERELRATDGFFKSKMCRFASSGRCKHGSACRFAHAPEEINKDASRCREPPMTELAQAFTPAELPLSISGASGCRTSQVPIQEVLQAVEALTGLGLQSEGVHSQQKVYSRSQRLMFRDGQSDQSTRAGTVTSPEGSGDSGEEATATKANMPWPEEEAERTLRRRRQSTTMMLINVPEFLTQGSLISLLEDLSPSMRESFDFFYLPWDDQQEQNLGYAIINLFTRAGAEHFTEKWSEQPFPGSLGQRLRVVPAALQGREANVQHFSGFRLAQTADHRFRPAVRVMPDESLQPMLLAEELRTLGAYALLPQTEALLPEPYRF